MLGLDAKTLSIPDYEITTRLERLLSVAQPAMMIPMVTTPLTTTAVHYSRPQSPYHHHEHIRSSHSRHRSPSPMSRRSDIVDRARSLSPLHAGIDPRTY